MKYRIIKEQKKGHSTSHVETTYPPIFIVQKKRGYSVFGFFIFGCHWGNVSGHLPSLERAKEFAEELKSEDSPNIVAVV